MKSLAIAFAVVAAVLFGTNPTQDEYVSWLKQQAINAAAGDEIGRALMSIFGGPVFNWSTTREDFLLFSIYQTDLGNGAKINVLGLLHHFVPINQPRSTPLSPERLATIAAEKFGLQPRPRKKLYAYSWFRLIFLNP